MKCCCEQQEFYKLKIEGDVGADPLWCSQCGCNFDLDDIPISKDIKKKIEQVGKKVR